MEVKDEYIEKCALFFQKKENSPTVIQVNRVLSDISKKKYDIMVEESDILQSYGKAGLIPACLILDILFSSPVWDTLTESEQKKINATLRHIDNQIETYRESFISSSLYKQIENKIQKYCDKEQAKKLKNDEVTKNIKQHQQGLLKKKFDKNLLTSYISPHVFDQVMKIALSFAASVYPQRTSHMDETERKNRLENYLSFIEKYEEECKNDSTMEIAFINSIQFSVGNEALELFQNENLLCQLLSHLSSTTIKESTASYERRNGAALYLGSCTLAQLKRIKKNWESQHPILDALLSKYSCPPTMVPWLREKLKTDDVLSHLKVLEKLVNGILASSNTQKSIDVVWSETWDKLNSGFPYYQFRSSLKSWFIETAKSFAKPDKKILYIPSDVLDNFEVEPTVNEISPNSILGQYDDIELTEVLVAVREGYRFVRSSFSAQAPNNTNMNPMEKKEFQKKKTFIQRKIIDEIFEKHYELVLKGNKTKSQTIKQLIDNALNNEMYRSFNFTKDSMETDSTRFKNRLLAYRLGRFAKLKSSELISYKINKTRPFEKATKIIFSIASFSKTVAFYQSFLLPFSAWIFFQSRINKHFLNWDFKDFLAELWLWFKIREPSHVDFHQPFNSNASKNQHFLNIIKNLFSGLLECQTEEDVLLYLSDKNFVPEKNIIIDEILNMTNPYFYNSIDDVKKKFLEKVEVFGKNRNEFNYLSIPVWYLVVIEKMNAEAVIGRLNPDEEEKIYISEFISALEGDKQ